MLGDLRPRVHPDDLGRVREALIRHFKDGTPYCIEYRVRHQQGHWVRVEDSGCAVDGDINGQAQRMIGTRRDITARRQRHDLDRLAPTAPEATPDATLTLLPTL